jgi:hypothetical protein
VNTAILLGVTSPSAVVALVATIAVAKRKSFPEARGKEANRTLVFDDSAVSEAAVVTHEEPSRARGFGGLGNMLAGFRRRNAPETLPAPDASENAYATIAADAIAGENGASTASNEPEPRRTHLFGGLIAGVRRTFARKVYNGPPATALEDEEWAGKVEPMMSTSYAAVPEPAQASTAAPLSVRLEPIVVEDTAAGSIAMGPDGLLRAVEAEHAPDAQQMRAAAQADTQRLNDERAIENERLAAVAEGEARGRAWTETWWARLDPALDPTDLRARRALATSLGRTKADWARKLARVALEQEPEGAVRARLLGALVALGEQDPYPFKLAWDRNDEIERAALAELFGDGPFPWA